MTDNEKTDDVEYRVTAEGVEKSFGDNKVLRGVSFKVQRGTATTIIGPSGSGKTTLLRTLNALDRADAGVIRVDDIELDFSKPVPKPEVRRFQSRSGFVFQGHNLFPHKTVLENVTEGPLIVQKRPKDEVIAEALALLDQVGLAEKRDQYPYELSGGQQQRVGIARALMQEPEMILADEPVASLDPVLAHSILKTLEKLNQEDKITVLCSLHYLDLVQRYATSVIGLRLGEIVYQGSKTDIRKMTDEQFKDVYGAEAERIGASIEGGS